MVSLGIMILFLRPFLLHSLWKFFIHSPSKGPVPGSNPTVGRHF